MIAALSPTTLKSDLERVRLLFVGDLHLSSTSPISRKDDYPEAILRKVEFLRDLVVQRSVDFVVLLGDVFHKPSVSLAYLMRCISLFREFSAPVLTLVGNHDVVATNLASLERRPLGLLAASGAVSILGSVLAPRASLHLEGFHYGQVPLVRRDAGGAYRCRIAAAHALCSGRLLMRVEDDKGVVDPADWRSRGWTHWVLGHDHASYPHTMSPELQTLIVRPGALSRGSLHSYQLTRDVYVDLFEVEDGQCSIERIPVPVASALDVFRTRDPVGGSLTERMKSFVFRLTDVKELEPGSSPRALLRQLTEDEAVLAYCLQCFDEHGIF